MKSALITGITGFAGSHLAELLLAKNVKVFGTYRWRSRTENISQIRDRINLVEADLNDPLTLKRAVDESCPDYVFHLAAQSFVPSSWAMPNSTLQSNIVGTSNLLEAIRLSGSNPTVQLACSSEEYGLVLPEEVPIRETNPLRPLSPYAVSKVAIDFLGYQYFKSYGMKIIRTRGFNHTGPRRGDVFVTSNFAKQVADIEAGKSPAVVKVGNLSAKRDFTDVRDMVKAYLLAVEKCDPGEVYNICSDKALEIRQVLDTLLSFSKKKVKVEPEESRMRPSDVPVLLGDSTKFRKKTGWSPQIPIEKTLLDTLDYWRENAKRRQ